MDLRPGERARESRDEPRAVEAYADWTPSGTEVVFSSGGGPAGVNIWIQPADASGSARQLTALDGPVHIDSWAPDGRTLSAHHHTVGGGQNVLMIPFDGVEEEPETWLERTFNDNSPVFSPDGRHVAYVSDETGQLEIYIRPFPGPGGQRTVSVGGGAEPAWAPNGELFYRRPSDYAMMVVDVSTDPTLAVGPARVLFAGGSRGGAGGTRARYAVTANASRFLMPASVAPSAEAGAESGASPKVVVVQNWGSPDIKVGRSLWLRLPRACSR